MSKKIYLSPSIQSNNRYAYGVTTEMIQCNKIAEATKTALDRAIQNQNMQTDSVYNERGLIII